MQLICISVTHHNTPVELRECLSLPVEAVESAAETFPIRAGKYEPLSEMVVLSTCNRLEIYAITALLPGVEENAGAAFLPLLAYLAEAYGIRADLIGPYLHQYSGIQAVEHLYRVAAGLDSIAIGETQILGQVSRALELALRLGTARHVLSSLLREAIRTGKRVRTETEIGRHPTSISALAVRLADQQPGRLKERKVLVVGAGKMGGYALEALRERGVEQILLTNRTYSHAAEMVERLGGTPLPYDRLFDGLVAADVVFTSTAAAQPILRAALIAEVMARRAERPLTLIDLAVPRNVDARAAEIAGVTVFDMDDLQAFARQAETRPAEGITRAERIVQDEVAEYEKLLRIVPFLGELHKKVEDMRRREVERTLRHLSQASPEINEQIEILSRSLVRKILHEPTMHLRTEANGECLKDYVEVLSRLFDVDPSGASLSLEVSQQWEP